MTIDEEQRLVKAAQNGDSAAFSQLVYANERLVYSTIYSKVQNDEDALDLSQEVFIKIWRSLPNWRGECRFATWIYKVAVNCSLDFLRKAPSQIRESLSSAQNSDGEEILPEISDDSDLSSPERMLERNETAVAVRRAISKLSSEQQQVVLLRDIDGYSYEEISEMLSLEIGTVKSRINRARAHLKNLLADFAQKS